MFIEINSTLSEKEKEWVIISSHIDTQEIKNEISKILEKTNIEEIKPKINSWKIDLKLINY